MKKNYIVLVVFLSLLMSGCSLFGWTKVTKDNTAVVSSTWTEVVKENTDVAMQTWTQDEWQNLSTNSWTNDSWTTDSCDSMVETQNLSDWSLIYWEWKKVWWAHTWTVPVVWNVSVCNDSFLNAEITIDFDNLTVWDIEWPSAQKLVDHLKNEDFFDTKNFPKWKFTLNKIEKENDKNMAYWNLEIKWISKEISFPIEFVKNEQNKYNIKANFFLDRTERNIMYSSTKLIDTVKEKAIDDMFGISFDITTM